jgi:tryptophan synthase alpha chain
VSRLAATFDRLRDAERTGLVTYVTAGDPDLSRSGAIIRALDEAGADIIEIGVPYSDPIADGPAIQRASERALAGGANLTRTLDLVASVRADVAAPLVLFTYVNPILRLGLETFVARAADAGIDGVLLLDLPVEEAAEAREALVGRAIDTIFLVSPTTTDARLREAARLGQGFLYAISRLGVTGARDAVATTAKPLADRIRRHTSLPIALGFGISQPEHVAQVASFADAAVVGSALVERIGRAAAAGRDEAAAAAGFVRWLRGV